MPKKTSLILLIIVGVLVVSAFVLSMTWGIISVTRARTGYYTVGDQIWVVADNDLMQGERAGSFSKGELVIFDKCTREDLSQHDVVIYTTADGVSVKRISYISIEDKTVKIYAATDAVAHYDLTMLKEDAILGRYSSSSMVLGNLARFSLKFSGVLVLYVLPSIALIAYAITAVVFSRRKDV